LSITLRKANSFSFKLVLSLILFITFNLSISVKAEETPVDYDQENIDKIAEAVNETFKNYFDGLLNAEIKRSINQAIAKSLFLARDIVLKHSPQSKSALDIQKIANAFKFQNLPSRVKASPIPIDLIITALDVTKDFTVNMMVTQNPELCDDCPTYFKNKKVITWLIEMAYLDVKSLILGQFNPVIAAREAIVGNLYILADISVNVVDKALEAEDAVSQAKYSETLGKVMALETRYLQNVTRASSGDDKLTYLNEFETQCLKFAEWGETFDMYHWFGNSEIRTKLSTKCEIRKEAIQVFDFNKLERYKEGIKVKYFDEKSAQNYRELYFPKEQWDYLNNYCKDYCSASPFSDVSEDYIYYESIKWAYVNGFINGFQQTLEFRPEEHATVGQVLLVLSRYLGGVPPASNEKLLDVYKTYLKDEMSINLPTSIETLTIDRAINRQEFAQLLYSTIIKINPNSLVEINGENISKFSDSSIANIEINSLLARNIMKNSKYELFLPLNSLSRGEMSSSVFNLSKYLKSVHFLLNSNYYPRGF